jgi:hypothetical protein
MSKTMVNLTLTPIYPGAVWLIPPNKLFCSFWISLPSVCK